MVHRNNAVQSSYSVKCGSDPRVKSAQNAEKNPFLESYNCNEIRLKTND